MKALNCKPILFFLALVISGSSLFAKEVKKNLHKEFQTSKSSTLIMDVKFSELFVESWDKNLVSFDVEITVEHNDESKAAKMLDMIDVVMVQNGNEISFETEFNAKFSKKDWGKSKRFKVKITAKVPADIKFELDNTFGSTSITELTGEVHLENSFGSLVVDRLSGNDISVELTNGDVKIQELADASVEVSYGSLRIEKAANLDLEVNFGDSFIGEVNNLSAEVNMGELTVNKVAASFKTLDVECNQGSVDIGIDRKAGFELTASMRMGSIDYPELDNLEKSGNSMNRTVTGTHGNGNSSVDLEGNMGNIKIRLK